MLSASTSMPWASIARKRSDPRCKPSDGIFIPTQGHGFRHRTVRVDVDSLDATTAHDHLPARCGAAGEQWGLCSIRDTTADKQDVRHRADRIFEGLLMRAHSIPSSAVA